MLYLLRYQVYPIDIDPTKYFILVTYEPKNFDVTMYGLRMNKTFTLNSAIPNEYKLMNATETISGFGKTAALFNTKVWTTKNNEN